MSVDAGAAASRPARRAGPRARRGAPTMWPAERRLDDVRDVPRARTPGAAVHLVGERQAVARAAHERRDLAPRASRSASRSVMPRRAAARAAPCRSRSSAGRRRTPTIRGYLYGAVWCLTWSWSSARERRRRRVALAQHDDRADHRAALGVRRGDRRGLRDGGVGDERRLHLERADPVAGADDHVVRAPLEVQVAVLVLRHAVAGAPRPAVAAVGVHDPRAVPPVAHALAEVAEEEGRVATPDPGTARRPRSTGARPAAAGPSTPASGRGPRAARSSGPSPSARSRRGSTGPSPRGTRAAPRGSAPRPRRRGRAATGRAAARRAPRSPGTPSAPCTGRSPARARAAPGARADRTARRAAAPPRRASTAR